MLDVLGCASVHQQGQCNLTFNVLCLELYAEVAN